MAGLKKFELVQHKDSLGYDVIVDGKKIPGVENVTICVSAQGNMIPRVYLQLMSGKIDLDLPDSEVMEYVAEAPHRVFVEGKEC